VSDLVRTHITFLPFPSFPFLFPFLFLPSSSSSSSSSFSFFFYLEGNATVLAEAGRFIDRAP
jgi:hypothetical protein